MKNTMKRILTLASATMLLLGLFAVTGLLIKVIFPVIQPWIGRNPTPNTSRNIMLLGWLLLGCSLGTAMFSWLVLPYVPRMTTYIKSSNQKLLDTIQKSSLAKYISFEKTLATPRESSKLGTQDLIILFIFIIYSCLFFLSLIQDYPIIKLASDAANITSFAAAYDHQHAFIGDPVLGSQDRFGIYQNIQVSSIRFLAQFTHNYPFSFMILALPTTFLFLLSFYLLGKKLFQSRFWAIVFLILNTVPLYLIIDSTGIREPLPRVVFQSVFPFVILLLWKVRAMPNKWFLVSISTGALAFVHSVSTPSWAAGILLGYLALMPEEWGIKRRIMSFASQGLYMLLSMMPFIVNFTGHQRQSMQIDLSAVRYIYENHFPQGLLDIPSTIKNFTAITTANGLLPIAVVSLIVLYFLGRENHKYINVIILWSIGIFLVSIALPYAERIVERYLRLPPLEIELVRGIRHYIFIMTLIITWALKELSIRSKKTFFKNIILFTSIATLLLVYAHRETRIRPLQPALNCIITGRIICGEEDDLDRVLIFLKDKTSIGSKIFFANNASDRIPLAVRYISLRPLVYSDKDRWIIYTHPDFATTWLEQQSEFARHGDTKDWFLEDKESIFEFASNLGAEYLVVNLSVTNDICEEVLFTCVYQNDTFTIIKLEEKLSDATNSNLRDTIISLVE